MSLHRRLGLWYGTILVVITLLGAGTAEFVSARLAAQRRLELHEQVYTEVGRVIRSGGAPTVDHVRFPGVAVRITDAEGREILSTGPELTARGARERTSRLDGDFWVSTAIPDEVTVSTRRDARLAILGGGLAMVLVSLVGGLWLTRRALRPIEQVAATARRIVKTGSADARVPLPHTGDELEELVVLFNQLLDTQQAMIEQMRSSLDSIGHDLRTPLTRIRGVAELALGAGESDRYEPALETALEEAEASEQLLTRLLDLTRAEAGMMRIDRQPVEPRRLLERVAALYEHVADEAGIQLQIEPGDAPGVQGDATRLEQALANLVDNALKFSPAGTTVRLAVVQRPGEVGLQVADEGPGVPERERDRVFERLYRGDDSRNTEGAGLGLALVRAIAEAHGGSVGLRSEGGQGAELTVWLPA